MELPFQKFNGLNFHTWQVKTQMRLMHEGLWDIVHTGGGDDDTKKDKAKAIIGLALSDSYIHFIDLTKTPKEIWDRLSGFFGNGAAISLKSQLYSLKMQDRTSLSSHINDLMSLKRQLAEIKEKQKQKHENEKEKDENQLAEIKEKEKQKHENGKEKDEISGDADFIANILNSLSSKYSNAVFTISQLSLMSLINQLAEIKEKEKKQLAEIKEKEKKQLAEIKEKEKEKKQLAEIKEKEKEKEKHENEKEKDEISDADFIAIILNSLSSKYSNAVSTLSQLPSKSLDKTIATLLAEEKRMNAEDTDGGSQTEMALLSKGRMKRGLVEYSYYHKSGHTALNCRIYK